MINAYEEFTENILRANVDASATVIVAAAVTVAIAIKKKNLEVFGFSLYF